MITMCRNDIGLYRDDGLAVSHDTPQMVEAAKKKIYAVFSKKGLKITIEANKKVIDYLDVTLNLDTGKHQPYMKPGNTPLYVHAKSNHPPEILKRIPESINQRLSDISSDEREFNKAAPPYQAALKKAATSTNYISPRKTKEIKDGEKELETSPGSTLHLTPE